MDIQQSCFSGVMLAVGRLVGIEKTTGDKVSSKSRFYNTFDYFGYERQVGDCRCLDTDYQAVRLQFSLSFPYPCTCATEHVLTKDVIKKA